MNDLDHGVRTEFADICLGLAIELDDEAIERWIPWAVKQYFSYQCAYPEDFSRPEDFHFFYAHRRPPPGMHIYVGRGDGSLWPHFHGRRPLYVRPIFEPSERSAVALQLWKASYGQLIVQVVHAQDQRVIVPSREHEQGLAQLWPRSEGAIDLSNYEPVSLTDFSDLTKF